MTNDKIDYIVDHIVYIKFQNFPPFFPYFTNFLPHFSFHKTAQPQREEVNTYFVHV